MYNPFPRVPMYSPVPLTGIPVIRLARTGGSCVWNPQFWLSGCGLKAGFCMLSNWLRPPMDVGAE